MANIAERKWKRKDIDMAENKNPHNIVVGQKLYYVPNRHNSSGAAREVTVEKVGKKWIAIDFGHRIEIGTLIADGGKYSSPGCCFLSKKHYDEIVMLNVMWGDTRKLFDHRYSRPDHITEKDMIYITVIMERGK